MRVVYLHMLGGSARHWDGVTNQLPGLDHLPLDLPGFGGTPPAATDVAGLAHAIRAQLPSDGAPWMIVGHSMGAKIALVLALWAENGELPAPSGIVTLAGSPPTPEPMEDEQRARLIAYAVQGPLQPGDAAAFLDQNTHAPLAGPARSTALDSLATTAPAAWSAWLQHGSREDWAPRIGTLQTPALILSGAADEALGAAAQDRLMRPHFAQATTATIPGAKHILPLEQPAAIASHIATFIASLAIPPSYRALLTSPRVSTATRTALFARTVPPAPAALTPPERATLAALLARIVPGAPDGLPATVEAGLETGDGWRPSILPPDLEAYRTGLAALGPFATLDGPAQDAVLASIGTRETWPGGWNSDQMQAWFGDVRDAAIRAYVSHPTTLAHLRYGGVAYAGDGAFKPGFADPGLGGREAWEP